MIPVMVRGAPLVVAMSTAWTVRLLPMMAVMVARMIAVGSIGFLLSDTAGAPVLIWAGAPTELTTRCLLTIECVVCDPPCHGALNVFGHHEAGREYTQVFRWWQQGVR